MISKSIFLAFILCAMFFADSKLNAKNTFKQKIIPCDESHSQLVTIPFGRVTALNFPTNPKEVIPGEAGFDFKTIRSDLVIKALRMGAKTNLLVYLEGRRCSFHLITGSFGDELVQVRDSGDKTFEVKFNDK